MAVTVALTKRAARTNRPDVKSGAVHHQGSRLIFRKEDHREPSCFLNHRFTRIDTDENDQAAEPFLLSVLIGVNLWLSIDSVDSRLIFRKEDHVSPLVF